MAWTETLKAPAGNSIEQSLRTRRFAYLLFKIPKVRRCFLFTNLVQTAGLTLLSVGAPGVKLLQINPVRVGIWKCQRGLTVDNRGVHNDTGQVGVRHGFVQDEASDTGKIKQVTIR